MQGTEADVNEIHVSQTATSKHYFQNLGLQLLPTLKNYKDTLGDLWYLFVGQRLVTMIQYVKTLLTAMFVTADAQVPCVRQT